jgi:hypothetical protein
MLTKKWEKEISCNSLATITRQVSEQTLKFLKKFRS